MLIQSLLVLFCTSHHDGDLLRQGTIDLSSLYVPCLKLNQATLLEYIDVASEFMNAGIVGRILLPVVVLSHCTIKTM